MKYFFPALAAFMVSSSLYAQSKYKDVDEKVASFGSLSTLNVATIADTITRDFSDKQEKARAIFFWIANNISADPKATKQNDVRNNAPEKVVELRRGTALGFSLLFQEMCSDVNIRCLSIDGYVRKNVEEIGEPADEKNHSWNVVQLGQSPEAWYYADAFRAAGYLDKKMTVFTKDFTGEYFFADRRLFNLVYFADNSAWQLGEGPKNLKDFYSLPLISNMAFPLAVRKPTPATGFIKAKIGKPVSFIIPSTGENRPKKLASIRGDDKKATAPEEIDFEDTGSELRFSCTFKKEEEIPFRILADGKELLVYRVEVTE